MGKGLKINDLKVSIEEKEILKGISLDVKPGTVQVLMGPNGSGKSTLASVLMGHPKYKVDAGTMLLDGVDLNELSPDERSKKGLFLSFQYPREIPGVTVSAFLRKSLQVQNKGKAPDFKIFNQNLNDSMESLHIHAAFKARELNKGFSGGEKKRSEILQMLMLRPKIALLDEPDSGLDVDALKIVASAIQKTADQGTGILLITHYQRILKYLRPDTIHIIIDGKIVQSGSSELAERLEKEGYAAMAQDD